MIQTRSDLKEYIKADRARYHSRKPRILSAILNDEGYYVLKFLYALRHLEYYTNNRTSIFNKIRYYFWVLRHRQLEIRFRIRIEPNVIGKGVFIPHIAGG